MGFLITFKSVTHAQRGARVLSAGGIVTHLVRPATVLACGSCGYALRMNAIGAYKAVRLLRQSGVPFVKTFYEQAGGEVKEAGL